MDDATIEAGRAFLRTVQQGQVRRGVVSSLANFGAFVDLGGCVDGLVNVAEVSWLHYDRLADVVEVGQEVTVVVLDIDPDRVRMSLSLKALQFDPFKDFARTHLGRVLTGRVTRVVPFGVFVHVHEGIAGLLHKSAFDAPDTDHPAPLPHVGDEVVVEITDINFTRRTVSLTLVR
ncbi:S1 RNA-binding domain-containing protein [Streptomyces virginiae]|uniref:S1 RNA-binding domain-containing protein n=1 Tax=Streptomyces virginiae TaxID=1961 RepID=UPI00099E0C5B|nr:S1 RNA-binding domain-containing protein [Streptomyces virginiae]